MKQVFLRGFLLGSIMTVLFGLAVWIFSTSHDDEYRGGFVDNRVYKEIVSHCSTKDMAKVDVVTRIVYMSNDSSYVKNDVFSIDFTTREAVRMLTYKEYLYDITKNGGRKILEIRDSLYGSKLSDKIGRMDYYQKEREYLCQ